MQFITKTSATGISWGLYNSQQGFKWKNNSKAASSCLRHMVAYKSSLFAYFLRSPFEIKCFLQME